MFQTIARWLSNRLSALVACAKGVSAVEFSLLSPVLVTGALATTDAGMAVYQKMMITQALRSGAHSAIAAESEAQVLTILQATAADNFTVASGSPSPGELAVNVDSYCVCPSDMATQVACTTVCTGGTSPNQFYQLTATQEFQSVLLPHFNLSGSIDVIAN